VILLASAATTTDGSDHLSTGNNWHAPNARKSLAAQYRSHIAPENRGRFSELRHVLGWASKRRRSNSFGAGSFRSENPVPSPRADKTKRPASSTTVADIGVPSSRAFACAALTAFSAISSLSSAMSLAAPFQVQIRFDQSPYQ
jgi:hypothetical protein